MDAIHSSRVFGWIEQPDVPFPHVQVGEPSVGGSLSEHGATVGVPLNGNDRVVSEDEVRKEPSTSPGEEVHGAQRLPLMAAAGGGLPTLD